MITELRPAGAEHSVYELARRLDRDRFDVQVIALQGGDVARKLTETGIKVHILGVRGKWDVFKARKLVNLLRNEHFDLLHTHLFHADLAGRIAAHRAAVPHLIHSVRTAEGRFRPWRFAFARLFSENCDRLVCVSRSVRDLHSLRSGLPLHRYSIIENGVDVDRFVHKAEARSQIRQQWNVDSDEPVVAFVGRLSREKGIQMMLATMCHLASRGTPIRLVIAGDGPERRVVSNYIAHGEGGQYCTQLGFVDDVRSVLSGADMLILPSQWEGWPMAAGEAMSSGLPVIGTDVAGIRDAVEDGVTGILVREDDVVRLAEAVLTLAKDKELRMKMGAAARQSVVSRFSIDATVSAHEKLYLEILQGQQTSQ